MKYFCAFLGGALAGAIAALLLAPESGEDMRAQIKNILRKYGITRKDDIDELVEEIAAEIEQNK